MFKRMFARKGKKAIGNPKHIDFCSSHDIRALRPCASCGLMGEFTLQCIPGSFLFGESFAKALANDDLLLKTRWPKLFSLLSR